MADQHDNPPPGGPPDAAAPAAASNTATAATSPAAAVRRRGPRRLLIALALLAALLLGAFWLLGRESTLQQLVRRVADASGGQIAVTGVSGSLYHRMHIARIVYRTKDSVVTADDIDIDWSPLQYFSEGLAISELHAASLTVHSLGPSAPAVMPSSLAAPFRLSVADARLDRLTLTSAGTNPSAGAGADGKAGGATAAATTTTVIDHLRFKLDGDKTRWHLRAASAHTAFGAVTAELTIAAARPFALQGKAALTPDPATPTIPAASSTASSPAPAAAPDAARTAASNTAPSLTLQASGNLALLELKAQGAANGASGDARLALAPFDPVALRAIAINGRDLDPSGFDPGWPQAKFSLALDAAIAPDQKLSGGFALRNEGRAAPIDRQGLPLQAFSGRLGGTLTASTLEQVLIDLGAAGRFTGGGDVRRGGPEAGIDAANFRLRTDRLDLQALHSGIDKTAVAGDIVLTSTPLKQTLSAALAQSGLRLDLQATLADAVLQLHQLRLTAGKGGIGASGQASLKERHAFAAKLRADHFDPSALGRGLPAADLNADIDASGHLTPAWRVAAAFQLKPSKLFGQPLSGNGKLDADAGHVSGVAIHLAMARNTADISGGFGAPGEQLRWKVDAGQLSAVRAGLQGAVSASGVVTGTLAAPRGSFVADARGLALAANGKPGAMPRAAADNLLHASGEVWLPAAPAGKPAAPELKLTGTVQRLNPAAFGAAQAGAINAGFTAEARLAADWRAALNLTLQPSTLANAPFSGYARLNAAPGNISNADIDLRLGANSLQAKGGYGSALDKLEWKLDAPQLGTLGPQFGGTLRAAGTLSGTSARPALSITLDGAKLRAPGQQEIASIHGGATLGNTIAMAGGQPAPNGGAAKARAGAEVMADVPLVGDIEIAGYASPALTLAKLRLQTSGSRSAHTLQLSASNADFDAALRVRGGWANDSWTGFIDTLQNRGRYALTLAAPAPLRLVAPAGTGVAGLLRPERIALGAAAIKLPDGAIRIDSLEKNGPAWRGKGAAAGVPVNYLAQLSDAWRDNVRSDMTIGAEWSVAVQAGAAGAPPALAGMAHVYRERGDLTIAGADLPLPLGLRTLDARADIDNGALRLRLNMDGVRAGQARIDASVQLRDGRLADDSPVTVDGDANMGSLAWLAPLAGLPGLEIDGTLKLAVKGGGTMAAPRLAGDIGGDKLVVNWVDQGIKLRNGVLRARLDGDQLQLQQLSFDGAEGRAQADGWMRYAGNEATMQLKLSADKLEVLARPDRVLVLSGQSTLTRDAKRFQLDGKFRADRASIELAGSDTPTLSDDVVIVGKAASPPPVKATPGMPLNIDLEADLGDAFALRGKGLDGQLAGALRIRVADRRPPRVTGSIRVVNGTYAAYGQKLAIERGVINFTGAYDNPGLNILAVRRRPEGEALSETNVEAGVEVRGTAQAPSAKLVSTPAVSDSDKLAWLVLGHGIDSTAGNEMALLGTAAGALFGGGGNKLANSLGLDELGVGQATGAAAGAATGLQSTVVTVGKRLSSRAYLSFEQGASTATSLVKLKYKLNPRITLQFQTGTNNALDVLYTWAFD